MLNYLQNKSGFLGVDNKFKTKQKRSNLVKLGANSVLYGGYDMETAFKHIAMTG